MSEPRLFAKGYSGDLRLDDTYVEIRRSSGLMEKAAHFNRAIWGGDGTWETRRIPLEDVESIEFKEAGQRVAGYLKIIERERDDSPKASKRGVPGMRVYSRIIPGASGELLRTATDGNAVTFMFAQQSAFIALAEELEARLRNLRAAEARRAIATPSDAPQSAHRVTQAYAAAQTALEAAERESAVPAGFLLETCPTCGAPCVVPEASSESVCIACDRILRGVRCSACDRGHLRSLESVTSRVLGGASCPHCGSDAPLQSVAFLDAASDPPVQVVDYGAERIGRLLFRPRRVVTGQILNLEGLSGRATGTCTAIFDELELILVTGDRTKAAHRVPFAEVIELQVAGRGEIVSESNPGVVGGGFGTTMGGTAWAAAKGAYMAMVINELLTVRRRDVETIVQIGWKGGQVTLLNNQLHPAMLEEILEPVVSRIRSRNDQAGRTQAPRASSEPANDVAGRLRQLTSLREDGLITDEDFQAQKSRLLSEI